EGEDGADAVDVALDEVAAEALAEGERALQIDAAAGPERAERGEGERRGDGLDGEAGVVAFDDGLAGAVDGDGVAGARGRGHEGGLDFGAAPGLERLGRTNLPDFLAEARDHPPTLPVLSCRTMLPPGGPKRAAPRTASPPPTPAGI